MLKQEILEALKSIEVDISWIEEHKTNPKLIDQECLLQHLKSTVDRIRNAVELYKA